MSVLAKFTKQPADVQDFDIDFSEWLGGFLPVDTAFSHTVVVETGITLGAHVLSGDVVKVWLSGGTDGVTYKITATVVTTGGRTKQAEIAIKVRET